MQESTIYKRPQMTILSLQKLRKEETFNEIKAYSDEELKV